MVEAIALFTLIVKDAIPYAIAFTMGQFIVNTFMKMAFGGRVDLR